MGIEISLTTSQGFRILYLPILDILSVDPGKRGIKIVRTSMVEVASLWILLFPLYRCNNILYVRGVEEEEEDGEMKE